jgi:hypothetical protein
VGWPFGSFTTKDARTKGRVDVFWTLSSCARIFSDVGEQAARAAEGVGSMHHRRGHAVKQIWI